MVAERVNEFLIFCKFQVSNKIKLLTQNCRSFGNNRGCGRGDRRYLEGQLRWEGVGSALKCRWDSRAAPTLDGPGFQWVVGCRSDQEVGSLSTVYHLSFPH